MTIPGLGSRIFPLCLCLLPVVIGVIIPALLLRLINLLDQFIFKRLVFIQETMGGHRRILGSSWI